MKIEDILINLEITCMQNNISTQDVVLLYLATKLDLLFDYELEPQIDKFKQTLKEEHDLLWDLQPTIEEDEEHVFAVQHARDLYNILLRRELC